LSRWGEKKRDNEKFELLKSAIINHRCVRIIYANTYKEPGQRTVQPLKLLFKARDWYLKAYCLEKMDFRIFKLNRILQLELLNEYFSPISYPEQKIEESQKYTPVTLRFPKEMAYRVYDEFDIEHIKTDAEGNLTVTAHMPEDAWLVGFLLSFGTKVEIIEPVRLKGIVAKVAKEIYEKNKT